MLCECWWSLGAVVIAGVSVIAAESRTVSVGVSESSGLMR